MREGVHELNKNRYLNGEFRDIYEYPDKFYEFIMFLYLCW